MRAIGLMMRSEGVRSSYELLKLQDARAALASSQGVKSRSRSFAHYFESRKRVNRYARDGMQAPAGCRCEFQIWRTASESKTACVVVPFGCCGFDMAPNGMQGHATMQVVRNETTSKGFSLWWLVVSF